MLLQADSSCSNWQALMRQLLKSASSLPHDQHCVAAECVRNTIDCTTVQMVCSYCR